MYLTILLLLIYAGICLYGLRPYGAGECKKGFLSKEQTTILKGLCCIIVVFVHIPAAYSNKVQDLIGSFAYIAVTLYFLFSAYGLRYSFENKHNYGQHFIRNRIVVLLIPFIFVLLIKRSLGFNPYLGGLRFVYVLLLFYLLTYAANKLKSSGREYIVYSGVLLYSIAGYLFDVGFGWYVEALGFGYGYLLGRDDVQKTADCPA